MKYVSERANCSAWIVLDKKGNQVGKVQSIYGSGGKVTVNVFDMGKSNKSFQAGSASGGGYDKFTAALSGCVIDCVVLNDHWLPFCIQLPLQSKKEMPSSRRILVAFLQVRTKIYGVLHRRSPTRNRPNHSLGGLRY